MNSKTDANRQKIVIVFTDGVPTTSSDFDTDVANTAIKEAKAMKDKGTFVYTVGIFNGANPSEMYGASGFDKNSNGTVGSIWKEESWGLFPSTDFPKADRPAGNRFLNLVSNNYPSADSIGLERETIGVGIIHSGISYKITENFTRAAEGSYYLTANSAKDLNQIFQQIVNEISTLKTEAGKDTRRMLAERLCHDIPKDVCSLAYNMSFEKRIIRGLAALYSDLTDHLLNIHDNMKDLMVPFSKQSYCSAAMQGSYSIKYVLPALYPNNPELDYSHLEQVHHGQEASSAYLSMCNQTPEDAAETRKNLLKYCGLDTYAMVKVLAKLRESVQ